MMNVSQLDHKIYVAGSYEDLVESRLKGDVAYADVMKCGNFGIGTFDYLNGEMIALNGSFYRADKDAILTPIAGVEHTPFAIVCSFDESKSEKITFEDLNLFDLQRQLQDFQEEQIPQLAAMALKADVIASSIHFRSEENVDQTADFHTILKQQVSHHFYDHSGTLVGFYFNDYFEDLASRGFHFHFIDSALEKGGHVHNCYLKKVVVHIQYYNFSQIQII